MLKEFGAALLGAAVGGGMSILATQKAIESQQEFHQEQLIESRALMEMQFEHEKRMAKQRRLLDITGEILRGYGDISNLLTGIRQNPNEDYWHRLNEYKELLSVLGEHGAAAAVAEFKKTGFPVKNTKPYRDAYNNARNALLADLRKEIAKYN